MSWRWKGWFCAEAAVLACLCGGWLAFPGAHLGGLLGVGDSELMARLEQVAAAALCAWTWLYLRLVLGKVETRTFRSVQEALVLANVLLLAASVGIYRELQPDASLFLLHVGVLGTFLGMRMGYLVHTREVAWRPQVRAQA